MFLGLPTKRPEVCCSIFCKKRNNSSWRGFFQSHPAFSGQQDGGAASSATWRHTIQTRLTPWGIFFSCHLTITDEETMLPFHEVFFFCNPHYSWFLPFWTVLTKFLQDCQEYKGPYKQLKYWTGHSDSRNHWKVRFSRLMDLFLRYVTASLGSLLLVMPSAVCFRPGVVWLLWRLQATQTVGCSGLCSN